MEPFDSVFVWGLMKRMALPNSAREPHPGNANAATEFEQLLRDHVPALYRSAFRWTGTADRAEDLVQELLVRLLSTPARAARPGPPAPVGAASDVSNVRRPGASRTQLTLAVPGRIAPGQRVSGRSGRRRHRSAAGPAELAERQYTQERVVAAWEQLVEEHRVVLSMHDIEDYSLPELSQIMDVPIGTLKSRLHRARAKLRELLATERFPLEDRV